MVQTKNIIARELNTSADRLAGLVYGAHVAGLHNTANQLEGLVSNMQDLAVQLNPISVKDQGNTVPLQYPSS